jgi:site-specific recombinase XerD
MATITSLPIDKETFITYITIKKDLSEGSILSCSKQFKLISEWFDNHQCEFNKEGVERMIYDLKHNRKLKNNTLKSYIFCLAYIRDCLKDKGLPYEFLLELPSFKKNSSPKILLTEVEIDKILAQHLEYKTFRGKSTSYLDNTYLAMIELLARTGCRYFEAANLKVKYLDISAKKALILGKNGDYRSIYFPQPLAQKLALLVQDKEQEDYVFTGALGTKLHATEFSIDLKTRAIKAGITKRVHPHLLRHCYGTREYEATKDIAVVATLLGHRDIKTTYDTYVHMADDTIRKAANMHPTMRKYADPKEIIKRLRSDIESLHLDEDKRFKYQLVEDGNSIRFECNILDDFFSESVG